MDWKTLLSQKRIRDLYEAGGSIRASAEKRGEFQRDYGRAVFSAPVRRLQDKAQVFPLEASDAVRTRLTHSMEVSSVARNIAEAVAERLLADKKIDARQAFEIATISATCGLIHDLGNPPFGHAGEIAMQGWFHRQIDECEDFKAKFDSMSEEGRESSFARDFLNFDGNPQSLRLLSKLQLVSDAHGMNLTCGTLSASCKYIASSSKISDENHAFSKLGYFSSETDLVEKVQKEVGTGKARNPITYLVEAADDIVYSTVDIEDGVKKGVISWEECEGFLRKEINGDSEGLFEEAIENMTRKVDGGPMPPVGKERQQAMASIFRTFAIGAMVPKVIEAFFQNYDEIMQGSYKGELWKDSKASGFVAACKDVTIKRILSSDEVLKLEFLGKKIVTDLMDLFWFGASGYSDSGNLKDFEMKAYRLMSPNYRNVFESELAKAVGRKSELPEFYLRLQLVTDYVCGMTDTFAQRLHKKLNNG